MRARFAQLRDDVGVEQVHRLASRHDLAPPRVAALVDFLARRLEEVLER